MSTMWSRVSRLRTLDMGFLHHTEWPKKLGTLGIAAYIVSSGFPTGVFLLLPYCAREIAGPSTSLSVLIAFVVTILTGLHLVEMCGRVPKSGCTYTFVYVTFGEIWAFLCAWTTIFDYCALAAYLAKGWSTHFDYMFHGNVKKSMNPVLFDLKYIGDNGSTEGTVVAGVFEDELDMLAAVGLIVAAILALLGVSVVATICMTLLIVGTLVISSSILVGFFYANVSIWPEHGYFIGGFEGVCLASSYLLRPMIGLEVVGSLVEETSNPQNRLAILIPLMNSLLFIYLFTMSNVITLVVPYFQIPSVAALPSIYGLISVPASRYVLSVGSICALSGAMLSSLLPPVRYIHALSADGLLCGIFAKFTRLVITTPLAAFGCSLLVTFALLLVRSSVLLSILRILLPARFMLLTMSTLLQRYRDTATGLLAEVANYKAMQLKSKSLSSFFSGGASTGDGSYYGGGVFNGRRSSVISKNTSDRYSISSSMIMRNIGAAQYEIGNEDEDDDDSPAEVLFEHKERSSKRRKGRQRNALTGDEESETEARARCPLEEDEVTIFSRSVQPAPIPRSVTSEISGLLTRHGHNRTHGTGADTGPSCSINNIKKSATSVSFQSVNLNDPAPVRRPCKRVSHGVSHNCIRSPCSPTLNSDPFYHLYQREIPEGMPYCETFSMYSPSNSAVNQGIVYRKAMLWLGFCVSSHMASSISIVRGWHQLQSGVWWIYVMTTLSFTASVVGTVALGWLPQNMDNRVRHQVQAAPYLSLLNTFLLTLMLATADFGGVWKVAVILAVGTVVYASYGYRHSVEYSRSVPTAPQTLISETDEHTGLVAPPSSYQASSRTVSRNNMDSARTATGANTTNGQC